METNDDILASLEDLDQPKKPEEKDPLAEAPEDLGTDPSASGSSADDPFNFSEEAAPSAPKAKAKPKPKTKVAKAPPPKEDNPHPAVGLSSQVAAQVVGVLGRKQMTVRELTQLKRGDVVDFNRFPNEAIDLVANGKLMAKGELVEIEGKLGVRIIKIF